MPIPPNQLTEPKEAYAAAPGASGAESVFQVRLLYSPELGVVRDPPVAVFDRRLLLCRSQPDEPLDAKTTVLELPDGQVSRKHAQLYVQDARLFIEDLRSRNGTIVNHEKVERAELFDGDLLEIGNSFLIVRRQPLMLSDAVVPGLIGVSRAAAELRSELAQIARARGPVLLLGETGTGKEVAAEALHKLSGRSGKLVPVNCAAITHSLAESQFFGARRGAYTEAPYQTGYFREADKGTLFLDEFGDLPPAVQPKLLRAFEKGEVTPLGDSQPIVCDVRLIAATNRNLQQAEQSGGFRSDLLARVEAFQVVLPPLRERKEDILILLLHFLKTPGARLSPTLVAELLRSDWPRNVRGLYHLAEVLKTTNEETALKRLRTTAALPPSQPPVSVAPEATPGPSKSSKPPEPDKPDKPRREGTPPSKERLIELLEGHQGNLHQIAKELGYSDKHVRRWIEELYGLDINDYRPPHLRR